MNVVKTEKIAFSVRDDPKFLENLNISMKDTVQNSLLVPMSKFGYNSVRSAMWVIEECVLQCDFANGGQSIQELILAMLKNFDGFHGIEIKHDWIQKVDFSYHWNTFSLNSVDVSKYENLLKNGSDCRRMSMVIKLASMVLSILEKNPNINVNPNHPFLFFEECFNEFVTGLLNAFMNVFPKVLEQVKLPSNESLMRVRKFQDNMQLPGVGSLLKKRRCSKSDESGLKSSSSSKLMSAPLYYLPETIHPSWNDILSQVAPPPMPLYIGTLYPETSIPKLQTTEPPFTSFDSLTYSSGIIPSLPLNKNSLGSLSYANSKPLPCSPSADPSQLIPNLPPTVSLSPVAELDHMPIIIVQIRAVTEKKKRRCISKEDRAQLKSFVQSEDLKLPTREAVRRVMERQRKATGSYDHFNQVRSLISKMKQT